MKSYTCLLAALTLLVGCATPLHVKVDTEITKGDSQERVREVLGDPDSFAPSRTVSGGTDWTYKRSGSICNLSFNSGALAQVACDSSEYVGAGGKAWNIMRAMLKGAGEGLKNTPNVAPIHCRPDLLGGYYCN